MKKICMLLALLSGVSFATENQSDTGCKVQELGGCEFLYTCENSVSMIVTKKASSRVTVLAGGKTSSNCEDEIVKKELIDIKNKQVINLGGNK